MGEEKIRLGKVVNSVGLKGELKIFPYTDYKEKFEEVAYIILDEVSFSIENVRYVKSMAILKLSGINDRNAAEKYKDKDVFIFLKDAPPLPEGSFYVKDLKGLIAVDEEGVTVGRLSDVLINSSQDIYMIEPEDGGKAFPVPAVEEFIKKIDLEKGQICIKLIEGLRQL
jgi:16S rRNA processing protein RimM